MRRRLSDLVILYFVGSSGYPHSIVPTITTHFAMPELKDLSIFPRNGTWILRGEKMRPIGTCRSFKGFSRVGVIGVYDFLDTRHREVMFLDFAQAIEAYSDLPVVEKIPKFDRDFSPTCLAKS